MLEDALQKIRGFASCHASSDNADIRTMEMLQNLLERSEAVIWRVTSLLDASKECDMLSHMRELLVSIVAGDLLWFNYLH